jgi:Major Facilitator Superfamily
MTGPGDYIPFVISRWLAGTFGSAPSTIGAGTILDIFFLHQRGKAFVCYTLFTLFGTQFGPTVGGFIIENAPWPVQFWWVVGVEGFVVILVLLFLQETRFPRDSSTTPTPQPPESYLSNRLRTFFPGTKVVPADLHRNSPTSTFFIALCPVTILSGLFLTITFGWAVAVTTLLSVFLQTPTLKGGYGFTPLQNACFSFAQWLGIGLAELYGMSVNDRIPLWMCKRSGKGVWKPEYRLFPLLIPPFIILPSAFGLFGAALQYHLHYMVLALAVFLINFCEVAIVPIVINYVVESFTDHAAEVTTVLNFYRLVLGLLVPFFILPWEARVGAGWVFGMMAFFAVFAFGFMAVLAWRGPAIRRLSFERFRRETEEGVNLNLGGSGGLGGDVEKK